MGRLTCGACMGVGGLSADAGHSSGIGPISQVEDHLPPERRRGREWLFLSKTHLGPVQ